MRRAGQALYSALMRALQPLLRLKLAQRRRSEPGYGEAVAERFGDYRSAPDAGFIWLHAVSLGETRAAAPLIAALRARLPGMRLLLTSGTATGRAEAARLLLPGHGDVQVWQPWDTPAAVRRFLQHFKPRIGILMETEVWPNLCAACAESGTPLVLANARLSPASLRKSLRFAWLARPAYRSLRAVWPQTTADAQRLQRLGAPVAGVFGNLKFDARPDAAQLALGQRWRASSGKPVLMFASSREGEEAQLLGLLQRQRHNSRSGQDQQAASATHSAADHCQWLIVPRHPQRFAQVAQLVGEHGFSISRRSHWGDAPEPADIWLGDSLGEMAVYYALSDVALLGGSFEPLGGQNLIEALACGCPVVLGPHTFNFAQAAELAVEAGAAWRVDNIEQAVQAAAALAAAPERRQDATRHADAFIEAHRDAAARTADAVVQLLGAADGTG